MDLYEFQLCSACRLLTTKKPDKGKQFTESTVGRLFSASLAFAGLSRANPSAVMTGRLTFRRPKQKIESGSRLTGDDTLD
jgi:hypothetical protein